uniref:Uncharacterized protein n=1 Tax=Anguilla anguilla TaxID=7936 RepID=A0A0E9WJ33_ANGAN
MESLFASSLQFFRFVYFTLSLMNRFLFRFFYFTFFCKKKYNYRPLFPVRFGSCFFSPT